MTAAPPHRARPHARRPRTPLRRWRVVVLALLLVAPVLVVSGGPATGSAAAGARRGVAVPAPVPRPRDRDWPLRPRPEVVAGFDPPDADYGAGHRGVDLAGALGQSVLAAAGGTVTFTGSIGGKPVVVVDHGPVRTTYEPVVASLARGTRVSTGDVLGTLTNQSGHCFPAACLHWGLRRGEAYLDPLTWIGHAPVRLLPLWRDQPVPGAGRGAAGPLSAGDTGSARQPEGGQAGGSRWRPVLSGWEPLLRLLARR